MLTIRYFDGQEVFHIHVNDYKDIRLLEKARKRAPKDIRSLNNTNNNKDINGNGVPQGGIPADHHAQEGEESSSDEEMYENMTSDFNTLIPRPKANSVQSKKPVQ